jgi:phytoene dehydrogenase-like protein
MVKNQPDNTIIIIGAGFAGLAAGIYARMKGYDVQIFEMHNLPGGLCTSWDRKGYTFDCCIHWLVGSSPESGMNDMWQETGIAAGREFINIDKYLRMEGTDGRVLTLYTDVDRLEKHLLEFSPKDEVQVREFIKGIRMCIPFDPPSKNDPLLRKIIKQTRSAFTFIRNGKKFKEWMNITCGQFASRFSDPMLKKAFEQMWVPEFSMMFVLFTFAYMHNKNAAYPIGGSLPMSRAMEKKFLELGGTLNYRSRVTEILTEGTSATGIRLDNGAEHKAGRIISAADGHTTIFEMLHGKFGSEKTFEPYEKWQPFPALLFISLGIRRKFEDIPDTISGLTISLKEPVLIGDRVRDSLTAHIYSHDPTMAPDGCTAVTVMMKSDIEYWQELSSDRKNYELRKAEAAQTVIEQLERRFPGISQQVEVIDVATPLTFVRYTGNWKGSFEGWLLTPENAGVMLNPMSQTLPGLNNFYMCGQWVEPGGGLPSGVMSAQRLIKKICREDGKKFS